MPRYVAFLRAINVGGRTVKMEALRGLFSELGFANVETFIASGNLIFEAKPAAADRIEQKIEKKLADALGYPVAVFVRTLPELRAIAAHQSFPAKLVQSAQAFNIGFCKSAPTAEKIAAVQALTTPIDDFHIAGRELYWLCRQKQSDSTFSNARFERAIDGASTIRSATTIVRLASKYAE